MITKHRASGFFRIPNREQSLPIPHISIRLIQRIKHIQHTLCTVPSVLQSLRSIVPTQAPVPARRRQLCMVNMPRGEGLWCPIGHRSLTSRESTALPWSNRQTRRHWTAVVQQTCIRPDLVGHPFSSGRRCSPNGVIQACSRLQKSG